MALKLFRAMEFPADINHLHEMLSYIRSFFVKKKCRLDVIRKVELAAEEAIVNIISYAYPHREGDESIMVDCSEKKGVYEVIIIDRGIPFNPLEHKHEVEIEEKFEQRKIGGLGIFLMRKLVSDVSYARVDGSNVLTIIVKATQ